MEDVGEVAVELLRELDEATLVGEDALIEERCRVGDRFCVLEGAGRPAQPVLLPLVQARDCSIFRIAFSTRVA